MHFISDLVNSIAEDEGTPPHFYRLGAMIETLESGQNIEEIAKMCNFISIGSNDYTAAFLDCDRSDWNKRRKITDESGRGEDPFIVLDPRVAASIGDIIARARAANPKIKISLCGAHATDITSLERLRPYGLDEVSVPPSLWNTEALPTLYGLNGFAHWQKNRPSRPGPFRLQALDMAGELAFRLAPR
jgi:phosphoenolpyruvate synthase/pyruvate phosphate dikinase